MLKCQSEIAQKLLTAFSKFDESSWDWHSVWKLLKMTFTGVVTKWDFWNMIFKRPFERLYHCQKICNRMQGLQSQEALFGIASRKWLFWISWMTSLLQKCQAMIMQSKVNNIKKMVNFTTIGTASSIVPTIKRNALTPILVSTSCFWVKGCLKAKGGKGSK